MILPITLCNLVVFDPDGSILDNVVGIRSTEDGLIEVEREVGGQRTHQARKYGFALKLDLPNGDPLEVPAEVGAAALVPSLSATTNICSYLHAGMFPAPSSENPKPLS